MSVSNQIREDLLQLVQRHDYSHMMSDSNSVWESGMREAKLIEAKIHAMCTIHREDAEQLYRECIDIRPEQYIDGLTHKTINIWFRPYIDSIWELYRSIVYTS